MKNKFALNALSLRRMMAGRCLCFGVMYCPCLCLIYNLSF
ncbi:hypothetical protein JCM19237_5242 [Photobacterium aphoticum]|uniref:Uncharacterized protein n=1 Tax=Photobacterium aphoticum TaxID=754436 RepID=A0A090QKK3_9GAMM|nr:hypothetical protein JCM19237_5242 [Photobacterium aphoticum]